MHQLTLTAHILDCYSNLHKLSIQCRKVILAPLHYLGLYRVLVYEQRMETYHECLCEDNTPQAVGLDASLNSFI